MILLYTCSPIFQEYLGNPVNISVSSSIEYPFWKKKKKAWDTFLLVENQKNAHVYLVMKYTSYFRLMHYRLRTHDYPSRHPSVMWVFDSLLPWLWHSGAVLVCQCPLFYVVPSTEHTAPGCTCSPLDGKGSQISNALLLGCTLLLRAHQT